MNIEVREAKEADLPSLNIIFNWHCDHSYSTFQDPTNFEERKQWFKKFDDDKQVLLVAEKAGEVIGFACSLIYRNGGVFKNTLETSVYVHHQFVGARVGSILYQNLFNNLKNKKVHRIVVGIALPNDASVALHHKFGFEKIGIFDEYAFYKEKYISSLWMQKKINV